MSNFKERLAEFIQDFTITQTKLEETTGLSQSNISDYINGICTPSYASLIKLLYFFDCSADYLLGRTEIPTEEKLLPVLPFNERLRYILKEKKVSQEQLKRDLSISGSVIYKWLSGKNQPTLSSLIKLADYFDCSVDYLIGRLR